MESFFALSLRFLLSRVLPIAASLMLSLSVLADSDKPASEYYEDAVKRFNEEQYEESVIQLKNVLQIEPRHLPALALLGRAYIKTGNPAAAESAITDAISSGADPSLLAVPLAQAYVSQFKYDYLLAQNIPEGIPDSVLSELLIIRAHSALAITNDKELTSAMSQLEQIAPDAVGYLNLRANIAMRYGRNDEARGIVERMVKLYPRNETAWLAMASFRHAGRDLIEALKSYDRVLQINSENSHARLAKLGLLLDLERDQEASKEMAILMETDSGDPRLRYLRSIKFARDGDKFASREELSAVINAIDLLDEAVVIRNEQLVLVAGMSHYNLGDYQLARDYFETYLNLGGSDPAALKSLASMYLKEGQYLGAVNILEKLGERTAMTIEVIGLLMQAYHKAGLHDKALALMETATSYPNTPKIVFTQKAISKLEAGYIEQGTSDLSSIFEEDSNNRVAGLTLATAYIKQNKFTEAHRVASSLIEENPADPTYVNLFAITSIANGEHSEARQLLEELLKEFPANSAAMVNLAKIDMHTGDFAAARSRLEKMLAKDSKNPTLMLEIARSYEAEQDLNAALRWSREALGQAPEKLSVVKYLIGLLVKTEQLQEASSMAYDLEASRGNDLEILELHIPIFHAQRDKAKLKAHLRRMAGLAGSHPFWLSRIAEYQVEANAVEDASYTLFKAVQSNPASLRLSGRLVELELQLNRIEQAAERATDLVRLFPNEALGYRLVGDVQMQTGKLDSALKSYQTAFKIKSNTFQVIRVFLAQRSLNKYALAEKTLKSWMGKYPDDTIVRHALAEFYLSSGKSDKAITEYKTLLEARPEDALLHNNLAYAYLISADINAGLKHARKAHEINPNSSDINDTLGWLLVNQTNFESGIKYLREALTRDATNPQIRYHLAVALNGLGRQDEAITEVSIALESSTAFPERKEAEHFLAELIK